MIFLHSFCFSFSFGKNVIPTPYSPKSGKSIPSLGHSFTKSSCGICNNIPAPSPLFTSNPVPPLCSIQPSIPNASIITECFLLPFKLATNPIPQLLCSKSERYNPLPSSKPKLFSLTPIVTFLV